MFDWIQNMDWAILHWIRNTLQCGALDFWMPKITALGNGGAVWIVAAGALTISKRYRRYGIAMLATLTAVSRLYLYVHFPSDVLAAAVLGIAIGLAACPAGKMVWSTEKRHLMIYDKVP